MTLQKHELTTIIMSGKSKNSARDAASHVQSKQDEDSAESKQIAQRTQEAAAEHPKAKEEREEWAGEGCRDDEDDGKGPWILVQDRKKR